MLTKAGRKRLILKKKTFMNLFFSKEKNDEGGRWF